MRRLNLALDVTMILSGLFLLACSGLPILHHLWWLGGLYIGAGLLFLVIDLR